MNEEHVDIRITRTGKKKTRSILDTILADEAKTFPLDDDHECMHEYDVERAFQYSLKKNPILERLEPNQEEEREEAHPEAVLTYSKTLRPMMRDVSGALEQRGQVRIRRFDRGDEIVWLVQVDRRRAKFLDKIFSDFITFLKRAFLAE